MRAFGGIQRYSMILLFLATFTAASIWTEWLPTRDSVVVRQDKRADSDSSSSAVPAQKISTPTESGSAATTDNSKDSSPSTTIKSIANTETGSSQTGSVTTGTQKSVSVTNKPTSTSYDASLPAGGVSMISPAIIDGSQYYKIGGDPITFAWNYTSLEATPTAVNIMATCTANSQLYTIAMNQTVGANSTGTVTWDTGAYQSTALSDPLLTSTYTLIIYDAASSVSATAKAGYLAVFNSYTFGMYTPQPYTPLADFVCATCSSALGDMEKRALSIVLGVSIITVLSFTWFVSGTGVIW
ncbi:hypothetical protein BJ878DRAFT_455921 [Calycina marina]|uniref:DUF7137 domain-containing protein n=1 Tax=Calycina marina TaxID=1763456 RepID=A0A9P8CH76_9HELO|nr:hypothetical protein BJ878DRAFT_455921 [Calycina marina]